jgi:hypothetical protein
MNMCFAYDGFTQNAELSCFRFLRIEGGSPTISSLLEVDLPFLQQSRVPVQEAPIFCPHFLTTASVSDPEFLGKFQSCRIVAADFRPLRLERERRAAEKAQRRIPRQLVRKPSFNAGLYIGLPYKGR